MVPAAIAASVPGSSPAARPAQSVRPTNPTPTPSAPNLSVEQLAIITTPDLPSLGTPDRFLPKPQPQMRLVIRLGARRVYVYENDRVKTSFPVAVGRPGWETPTGNYHVLQMIQNPAWQNPFTGEVIPSGRENPLGTRWIGFWTDGNNYIGFHGTPNEESVGTPASHGCIRMFDRDVQRLFEMVALGTPVSVVP
ncbi:L,D-transpeptidase [Leptolyngbya sp. FACHB-711]|uniref:L,D-transpeptidase n=1 Tax=unclassified Leptolyngbya TaxID=2650499 RepID=UPI001684E6AB|nr:L,D-transpeptidase [Leptolyngbya sp. FACHB-711]MBD1848568.1 L,D-transpeptidase family protein [Cyanobacteria bacterium FACHB-502]MBD2026312.1 L,D-transpeptidase family protein [Leptolyngbya sp. FACHB-711]